MAPRHIANDIPYGSVTAHPRLGGVRELSSFWHPKSDNKTVHETSAGSTIRQKKSVNTKRKPVLFGAEDRLRANTCVRLWKNQKKAGVVLEVDKKSGAVEDLRAMVVADSGKTEKTVEIALIGAKWFAAGSNKRRKIVVPKTDLEFVRKCRFCWSHR